MYTQLHLPFAAGLDLKVPLRYAYWERQTAHELRDITTRNLRRWKDRLPASRGWISVTELALELRERTPTLSLKDALRFILHALRTRKLPGGEVLWVYSGDARRNEPGGPEVRALNADDLEAMYDQEHDGAALIPLMRESVDQLPSNTSLDKLGATPFSKFYVLYAAAQIMLQATPTNQDNDNGAGDVLSANAYGSSPPAEDRVARWFKDRMRGWPSSKPPPREAEDIRAFEQRFGLKLSKASGIDRETFRNARRKYTPQSWHAQGQRKPWAGYAPKSA